jgi:phosphate uptake regulator
MRKPFVLPPKARQNKEVRWLLFQTTNAVKRILQGLKGYERCPEVIERLERVLDELDECFWDLARDFTNLVRNL